MMKIVMLVLFVSGLFFVIPDASCACEFNTDCEPGSKCLKASGSLYGVCVGGISPGNRNDQQPGYSPTDTNRTYGDTCQFNTDCGPGSLCVKSGGIYGTCMRNR